MLKMIIGFFVCIACIACLGFIYLVGWIVSKITKTDDLDTFDILWVGFIVSAVLCLIGSFFYGVGDMILHF